MKKNKLISIFMTTIIVGGLFAGCNKAEEVNSNKEVYNRPVVSTSDEGIKLLKDGNVRYVDGKNVEVNLSKEKREELKKGQNPFALVVSCSDSRVTAPHIFNQGLGDLFEVKLAGNVLNDEALGSVEYAVDHLNVPVIVLMSHEKCGAVASTIEAVEGTAAHPAPADSKIVSLVNRIKPAYEAAKKENAEGKAVQEEVCDKSLDMIYDEVMKNPIVKAKVDKGELKVVKAKYNLSGNVDWK